MHFKTIVFLCSIGLNLVLGIGWGVYYFNNSVYSRRPIIRQVAGSMTNTQEPTNAGGGTKLDWSNVESEDYATYIKNLRAIGCPETTIKDIIVADVNHYFVQRRGQQTLTNDVSWWRPETQQGDLSQRQQTIEALEQERRTLLTELLGPDWESGEAVVVDRSVMSGIYLGGPVLGSLSETNREAVYEIASRARSKIQEYQETQDFLGQPVDQAQLGRLRQGMRTELAKVLTPQQMEEFLLRYSETAEGMRREMRNVELTPEEFRNIFRIRDPLEQELAMLGGANNTAAAGRIRTLQDQIDASIRQALGAERYVEFKLNEDPNFRDNRVQAERLGVAPETMFSLYEITQETRAEEQRIRNDTTLSSEQRIDALALTQAEQQKAVQRLLGPEQFQRWQQLQQSR